MSDHETDPELVEHPVEDSDLSSVGYSESEISSIFDLETEISSLPDHETCSIESTSADSQEEEIHCSPAERALHDDSTLVMSVDTSHLSACKLYK